MPRGLKTYLLTSVGFRAACSRDMVKAYWTDNKAMLTALGCLRDAWLGRPLNVTDPAVLDHLAAWRKDMVILQSEALH